ncbi:MAG: sortase domain-containing protein [Actinomycetales bacterium]
MTRNSRLAVVALLVGAATAIGVPGGWWLGHRQDTAAAGALPTGLAALATPSAPAPAGAVVPDVAASGPVAAVAPVRPAAVPISDAAAELVSVRVPALGLTAAVDPVGVDGNGVVQIPQDVRRVGWYRYSSSPDDSAGAVTLVGHRDSRTQGKGVLYQLSSVSPGDDVIVTLSDGTRQVYRVVERREYLKKALPLRLLFERSGRHRLVLITCGGPYDRDRGGYQDNLVVTAVPVT